MRTELRRVAQILGVVLLAVAWPPESDAQEWDRLAESETVQVVSTNEDGSTRETKVWLVALEGQGYIRTGSTRWGGNVERDPRIVLRVAGEELPLQVEFVTDDEARERVVGAFREKYGLSDRLLSPFRGRNPKIMRLVQRSPAP